MLRCACAALWQESWQSWPVTRAGLARASWTPAYPRRMRPQPPSRTCPGLCAQRSQVRCRNTYCPIHTKAECALAIKGLVLLRARPSREIAHVVCVPRSRQCLYLLCTLLSQDSVPSSFMSPLMRCTSFVNLAFAVMKDIASRMVSAFGSVP